ncbi:E3 ubiquitin-protein ligase CIP8 isoform X1 [Cinnamomum micranthum f. kanehirae]|uniref:RING-type E3 ubiquitin transferase n=1 Tax=Cinnamomum micranthum f. kanehirae TaxID=337451 RepID=A0A443NB88_9MAGN|nr:E3 ubiquitin-protein ligase CIP8 isoform X1 [Cinnamomum micranthum f. kanehirae]
MSEALVARYWCHRCLQMVNPVMEAEIKCPFCESGFVEEMDGRRDDDIDLGSDRAFSLWAPILLGLMGGPSRHRRLRRGEEEEENQGESEQEREPREGRDPESIIRRRRRNSAAMLQFLRGLRSSELDTSESERGDRERVILINPFNRAVILEGSFDSNETQDQSRNTPGSLGDYFIGPGLDLLLQHLAENDPSRYGTPPAKKEAIEAMPTVEISENLECAVCLDDFNIGSEAKEMPSAAAAVKREAVRGAMEMEEVFGFQSLGLSMVCFPHQDRKVVGILHHPHLVAIFPVMRIERDLFVELPLLWLFSTLNN